MQLIQIPKSQLFKFFEQINKKVVMSVEQTSKARLSFLSHPPHKRSSRDFGSTEFGLIANPNPCKNAKLFRPRRDFLYKVK